MTTSTLRSLPPRPVRPSSLPPRPTLKAPKRVRQTDGTYAWEERDLVIEQRDARMIHLAANCGVVTLPILAYACGADETTVSKVMDSLRKRVDRLVAAGIFDKDGKGSQANLRLTSLGHKFLSGTDLPERFIPQHDDALMKNITSVVARVSAPRPSSFFHSVRAGESSVGFPAITQARIASDSEQMDFGPSGRINIARQAADLDYFLRDRRYPTVSQDKAFAFADISADTSNNIQNYLRTGFRSPNPDRTWVMTGSMFAVLDEHGLPRLDAVDFVVPLPHVEERGKRYLNALACVVEVVLRKDTEIRAHLGLIARCSVPFSKIVVFVPNDSSGLHKAYNDAWADLLSQGLVPEHLDQDHLLILGYEPVAATGEEPDFATRDTYGRGVKHYGNG